MLYYETRCSLAWRLALHYERRWIALIRSIARISYIADMAKRNLHVVSGFGDDGEAIDPAFGARGPDCQRPLPSATKCSRLENRIPKQVHRPHQVVAYHHGSPTTACDAHTRRIARISHGDLFIECAPPRLDHSPIGLVQSSL